MPQASRTDRPGYNKIVNPAWRIQHEIMIPRLISSLQSWMKCAQGRIGSFSTRNSSFPARTLGEVQGNDIVCVSCSFHDSAANTTLKCSRCRKMQPTTLLVDIIRSGKRSLIWSLTESESLRTTVLQLLKTDFRFADPAQQNRSHTMYVGRDERIVGRHRSSRLLCLQRLRRRHRIRLGLPHARASVGGLWEEEQDLLHRVVLPASHHGCCRAL